MATLKRLKLNQVLYSVRKQRAGNTKVWRTAIFEVKILEINVEEGYVQASVNHNPPQKYQEMHVKKWRVKKPEKKESLW